MTKPRRVLFVSPGPDLVSPASGEGARLKHLSRRLATDLDWTVSVLVPADTTTDIPWVERTYTYRQWSLPFLTDLNPSFVRSLAAALREQPFDVIHLSKGVCAASALTVAASNRPVIVYAAQNDETAHAREFVDPTLPVYKRLLGPRLVPVIERLTVACADRITTVSDADRRAIQERYGLAANKLATIPTGTEAVDRATLPDPTAVRAGYGIDAETVAVFHGSYAHPPNREAVAFVRDSLAPAVADRDVDLDFLLVGAGMPDTDAPNVHAAGFVEDLYGVLNAADMAVVPISHGGGTKTKLYDYLSLQLPFVSTVKGVAGVDLEDGVHARITDAADESFVEAVCELATDPSQRATFRHNLEAVAATHSWDRSAERLAAFYDSATRDDS